MHYDVTIAIPIFNAEKYIEESLNSALAQDYSSIEYLIVDDCGVDHSLEIVSRIKQRHPRGNHIRIISKPHNMGIGAARNTLLYEAKGDYLFFLDADDTIIPTTISILINKARFFNADIVMASHQRLEMYEDHKRKSDVLYPELYFCNNEEFASWYFKKYGSIQVMIWNLLINLKLIRDNRLFFLETNYWEDMEFMYRLVTVARRTVVLPFITYTYMCRVNSLSNFQNRSSIPKEEILRNAKTIESLKMYSVTLLEKKYFPDFLNCVLMTDFYIICNVLKNREKIIPYMENVELKSIIEIPFSFYQCMKYGDSRHLGFWLLNKMNLHFSIIIIKIIGVLKGIV